MKLYVAKSDGVPKFLVVGNEVYTLEAIGNPSNGSPAAADHPASNYAAKSNPLSKAKAKKRGRKPSSCSKCGEPGHNAKTCPENADAGSGSDSVLDAANNPEKPAAMDDEEIEQRVHEMQDEGMSSITIAAKLHVSLKKVNQFWRNRTAELSE